MMITLKGIIDEDFVNYKYPAMTLMFPKCSFKCEIGSTICQNSNLALEKDIIISIDSLCERYLKNPITKSIVCQGLEPFDSFEELENFITIIRNRYNCDDDIVIYTGYEKNEIINYLYKLQRYKNIIIKFGRYISDTDRYFDPILGIYLASNNQHAERIAYIK